MNRIKRKVNTDVSFVGICCLSKSIEYVLALFFAFVNATVHMTVMC